MKITSVEAVPFSIPYKKPVKWASGYLESAEHAVVMVSTDEGITGIGEAVPRPTIYGESLPSIMHVINNLFSPEIVGIDPFDLEKIWDILKQIKFNYCAKGALDVALHDIMGKSLNIPLYKLLGGWDNKAPLSYRVPADSLENMAKDCSERLAEGLKSFKIKVGNDWKYDLELVKIIREAIGPDANLYADANGNYDLDTAIKVIPEMQKYQLRFIEEPLPSWNRMGRKRLSQVITVPILADDSAFTPQDVFNEIMFGSIGAVSVKITRTGYYFSKKIINIAEQADIPVVVGTQAESALGSASSLQFAMAFKQVSIPSEITAYLNVKDQVINEELVIKNGFMYASELPGIGVTLNEEKLNYYRISCRYSKNNCKLP